MGFFDFFNKKKQAERVYPSSVSAVAPVSGTVVSMKDIPDAAFNSGAMGFCCGIEPTGGIVEVKSPFTGTIMQVASSFHALGVAGENGVQIILHVGVDTIEMKGKSFQALVREGQKVKEGDALLEVDVDQIRAAGYPAIVIAAVLNTDDFKTIDLDASGEVTQGAQLLKLTR